MCLQGKNAVSCHRVDGVEAWAWRFFRSAAVWAAGVGRGSARRPVTREKKALGFRDILGGGEPAAAPGGPSLGRDGCVRERGIV